LNDRRLAFANRSFPFAHAASKADGKNQSTNESQHFSHRYTPRIAARDYRHCMVYKWCMSAQEARLGWRALFIRFVS
jgi:hypothetical protein